MQEISRNLILEAASGDMDAFKQIYEKTSSYIYTLCYRVTYNAEDAEDATQEVFVSLHKNLWKFRFKSSFKTWLYRISVNTAINLINKRKRKQGKKVPYEEYMAPDNEPYEEIQKLETEEKKDQVQNMLKVLSPDQRACIVLKEIEGLKYEEIAKTLKIKVNTVRSRLKRAREKLIALHRKEVS